LLALSAAKNGGFRNGFRKTGETIIMVKNLFDDMIFAFLRNRGNEKLSDKEDKLNVFKEAFDNSNIVLNHTECSLTDAETVNVSDIATKLIQTAGRFCKHYASDFLISWEDVTTALKSHDFKEALQNKDIDGLYVTFGFRESGVDHSAWIQNQHSQYQIGYCEQYYREIYTVGIFINETNGYIRLNVVLKDVKESLMALLYRRREQNKF
jgi:hypothetical protein